MLRRRLIEACADTASAQRIEALVAPLIGRATEDEAVVTSADTVGLSTPDTAEPMITRSLRLSLDLDTALRDLAAERGIEATTLMREILQAWVTGADISAVVRLADVQRVIASLARPA